MQRTENVELTVLCLIHQNDKYLLQNRLKDDWKGFTLPGGHIEKNESIIDAVIREMKEETGLDIQNHDYSKMPLSMYHHPWPRANKSIRYPSLVSDFQQFLRRADTLLHQFQAAFL